MNDLNSILVEGKLLHDAGTNGECAQIPPPKARFVLVSRRRDGKDVCLKHISNLFTVFVRDDDLAGKVLNAGKQGRCCRVVGRLANYHGRPTPDGWYVIEAEHVEFRPASGKGGENV